MKKAFAAAVLVVGVAAAPFAALAGPSAEINAEEFYATAVELQGRGMRALFDKRVKPMEKQMVDAGTRARAANVAATKRGDPLYCVSEADRKKGMSSKQVIAMLGDLGPDARRRHSLEQAWLMALKRKFPC